MTTYIGWYDASKTTLQARLNNAIEIFAERRGYRPAQVLVNDAQAGEITILDGIEVEARHTVALNTFWLALRPASRATRQLPLIGGDV
jgi:hypothetical protein